MNRLGKGITAGFVATAVMSVIMMIRLQMGVLPEENTVELLTRLSNEYYGTAISPAIGWIWFFVIGSVVMGGLYAYIDNSMPGQREITEALWFAGFAWLVLMLAVMPLAGAGIFAFTMGPAVAVTTFLQNMVYGAVLGTVYAWLWNRSPTEIKFQ